MRVSRWGRSPYETEEDIAAEVRVLGRLVDVVAPGSDAEIAVIHSKVPFGQPELTQSPSLQLLLTTTSGTDHIDVDYLHGQGVMVARLPQVRRDAVVDSALGMLIWGLRRRGTLVQRGLKGQWARKDLPGIGPVGLRGSRIGLVGLGVIGTQMSKVLHPLGANLFGVDPNGLPEHVVPSSVDDILGSCDAISLHCDLNESSINILSDSRLASARKGIVVVNTARGGLVDVEAAVGLTVQGQLGALALDVFPCEPYPNMAKMGSHPNLLFTPHSAGYHTTLSVKIREGLSSAVSAFVNGKAVPYRL